MSDNGTGVRPYRAALYIRLSKEDGDKAESNSVSNQRELIYSYLKDKSDIQVCTEKVDDGYSGVGFDRPALRSLLEEVKQGMINCIIVKDLSRFGRNYIETGRYIQQIFPFMGVRFIAVNDQYDSGRTDSRMDNLLLPFKNLINDAYSRDISVKVRSQIEVRQRRGEYTGNFPVYGYCTDPKQKGKLVTDSGAADVVRDIFSMRIKGYNNGKIAEYLNTHGIPSPMEYKRSLHWRYTTSFKRKPQAEWSPVAVERILKNEMYTGVMVQGKESTLNYKVKKRIRAERKDWIRVENTHEAIIEKEDFALVRKLMLRDTRTAPDGRGLYLFSGLLGCGGCGNGMVRKKIRSGGKEYCYFICSGYKHDRFVCSSHRIREDVVSGVVLEMLRMHLSLVCTENEVRDMMAKLPGQEYRRRKGRRQLEQRRMELARYEKLKRCLYEDYRENLLTKEEYLEMKEAYEASCRGLEGAIEILEEETAASSGENRPHCPWDGRLADRGYVPALDRGFVAVMVEKIVVRDAKQIQIHFQYRDVFASVGQAPEGAVPPGSSLGKPV